MYIFRWKSLDEPRLLSFNDLTFRCCYIVSFLFFPPFFAHQHHLLFGFLGAKRLMAIPFCIIINVNHEFVIPFSIFFYSFVFPWIPLSVLLRSFTQMHLFSFVPLSLFDLCVLLMFFLNTFSRDTRKWTAIQRKWEWKRKKKQKTYSRSFCILWFCN